MHWVLFAYALNKNRFIFAANCHAIGNCKFLSIMGAIEDEAIAAHWLVKLSFTVLVNYDWLNWVYLYYRKFSYGSNFTKFLNFTIHGFFIYAAVKSFKISDCLIHHLIRFHQLRLFNRELLLTTSCHLLFVLMNVYNLFPIIFLLGILACSLNKTFLVKNGKLFFVSAGFIVCRKDS